jgi:hypothetical protein
MRNPEAEIGVRSKAREAPPEVKVSKAAPTTAPAMAEERSRPAKLRLKDVVASVPSEQREEYLRRLKELQTRRRVELAEDDIATEPRDSVLQAQVEGEARAALASLDAREFPTTRLGSVECGSTLCKIEVDQDSATEQDAFSGAFSLERRSFAVPRFGDAEEPGRRRGFTVVVATAGRRLPRAELEDLVALLSMEGEGYTAP